MARRVVSFDHFSLDQTEPGGNFDGPGKCALGKDAQSMKKLWG
jgi:hypothetical protein